MLSQAMLLLALTAAADPQAKMAAARVGDPAAVEIVGLAPKLLEAIRAAKPTAAELAKACRLTVGAAKADGVAVAGTWSVAANGLRFEPQFPLVPGVKYKIACDFAKLPRLAVAAEPLAISLTIPKPPPGPPVSVAAVFPSGDRLPENTLRWYIHFSGPMSRGDIYRRIKLVRDDGVEVVRPFLELDEELWSTDGLRVTVLFHPGRVKRELVPREEEGPILEEGRSYTLTISREWKDSEGRPLAAEFKKTFRAGPPDDEPIDPSTWTLIPPRADSDAPVILRLAKPLDRALLASTISVVDSAGQPVAGQVTVGGGERVVTFAPKQSWQRGEYRLRVEHYLEDSCGNRVGESFELDTTQPMPKKPSPKSAERPFTVQ
ncbi:MAG TPA: hypothetical protein VN641_07065 [Urbifossiella sp.]|nr:hypothetical protein [Urbifossiella sp.]